MFKEGDIVILIPTGKSMLLKEKYEKYTIKSVWNSDIPNWKVQYLIECNKSSYDGNKIALWVGKDDIKLDTQYYREYVLNFILD